MCVSVSSDRCNTHTHIHCRVCDYMYNWKNLRRLYNFGVTRKQIALIQRHSTALFPSGNQPAEHTNTTHTDNAIADGNLCTTSECRTDSANFSSSRAGGRNVTPTSHSWKDIKYSKQGFAVSKKRFVSVEVPGSHVTFSGSRGSQHEHQNMKLSCSHLRTHRGFDSNGFSLDPENIQSPDKSRLWKITDLYDLDECYTRRWFGFESAIDLYRWTSCVDLMFNIEDLPALIVNSRDDPLVDAVNSSIISVPLRYIGESCASQIHRPMG